MSTGCEVSRGGDNRSDVMESASTLLESNRIAITTSCAIPTGVCRRREAAISLND
jgi:hypothetical protein